MALAVLSGLILAIIAPFLYPILRRTTGWVLALLPFGLTIYFITYIDPISSGQSISITTNWVPSLNVNLSFYVDGLSLLFALLITGIGTFVIIYANSYLDGHPQLGRLFAFLLIFMASMLGLVLSNGLITLFIFWELTSISSYLLIGFEHERKIARKAASQALIITGAGGLVLLIGLILLAQVSGEWQLSGLLEQGDAIRQSGLYEAILTLVLIGAFTKSAQFPFHFWLPGAMEAPTPISAYLHSATMVKAGIYLLARFHPVLADTVTWFNIVTIFGAVTMLIAAILALFKTDIKQILAYSTISALGTLVLMLGLDMAKAIEAAMVFLVVHSLYKGGLFMVAGAVHHEVGTRDITQLGGLRQVMPIIAAAASLAALSMSGIPGFFGFIGKELIYEASLHADQAALLLTTMAVLANIAMVAVAGIASLHLFFGSKPKTPKKGHEAPLAMWVGPISLGILSLVTGILPFLPEVLIAPAVDAILQTEAHIHLAVWHGLNSDTILTLSLSVVTILGGLGVYFIRHRLRDFSRYIDRAAQFGPERLYQRMLIGLDTVATWQTRLWQNGYLRYYVALILLSTVGLVGYTLFSRYTLNLTWQLSEIRPHEIIIAVMILSATLIVVRSKSRLAAVAALGVVGFGVSLIFILFSAPDLAMTQISIETLTVVLLVLILYRLPRFSTYASWGTRLRDRIIALAVGGLMTLLILIVTSLPFESELTPYFAENSYLKAKGQNIVNVILVDFRGFDTMGEITVLSVAAIGVFALLKLRQNEEENS